MPVGGYIKPETVAQMDDLRELYQILRRDNPILQRSAIKRLVGLGGEEARRIMIRRLGDRAIRRELYDGIARIEGPIYEELIRDLHDEKQQHVSIIAARALGLLGDKRAIPHLVQEIDKPPTWDMKEAVIYSLGLLEATDTLDLIIEHLTNEKWVARPQMENLRVRKAAAHSLGQIGDKRAVDALIKSLDVNYISVRRHQDKEYVFQFQDEVLWALGAINDSKAIPTIIEAINDPKLQEVACEALNKFGPKSYDKLIELLHHENPDISSFSAQALCQLGDLRATEHLIKFLDCENWKPKYDAIEKMRDPKIVEPLIQRLEVESDFERIEQIIRILLDMGGDEIIQPFVKLYLNKGLIGAHSQIRQELLGTILNLDSSQEEKIIRGLINELLQEKEQIQNNSLRWLKPRFNLAPDKFNPAKFGATFEKLMLLDHAINWYTQLGELEEAARVRKQKAEMGAAKVSQKVVQGDEITSIQDSVVSKSSIGSGAREDLLSQLERLGALKEKGLITDDEFIIAKRHLLKV